MKLTRDETADTAYIQVRRGRVDSTVEINFDIYADVDRDGTVLGLELLNASRYMADRGRLRFDIPDNVRDFQRGHVLS